MSSDLILSSYPDLTVQNSFVSTILRSNFTGDYDLCAFIKCLLTGVSGSFPDSTL